MDVDLLLIFVFIGSMVAIVTGVGSHVYKRHLSFKERQLELLAERAAQQAAQHAARTEQIEQRVRVLERIATDRGADLAARIEDLRDPGAQETEKLQ